MYVLSHRHSLVLSDYPDVFSVKIIMEMNVVAKMDFQLSFMAQ